MKIPPMKGVKTLAIPHWRWLLLTICAVIVVALTTMPRNTIVVRAVEIVLNHSEVGETAGHAALFALLTAVIYLALRHRFAFALAFGIALTIGLTAGLITEMSQASTPGRTASLSDLLANWLGVFVVTTLISYRRR